MPAEKMRAMQQTIQQLQASLQEREAIVSLKSQRVTEVEREISARCNLPDTRFQTLLQYLTSLAKE